MVRAHSGAITPLADWLARNQRLVGREAFARHLGILRNNLDRLCRGDRRPGLDLAFAIEDLTRQLSDGWDVLFARAWQRRTG